MRRIRTTLTALCLGASAVVLAPSPPAGAAGQVAHALPADSVAAGAGGTSHITSPVPPLSQGYAEYVDRQGRPTVAKGTVTVAPTDPSGVGKTLDIQMTVNEPLAGPTDVAVEVASAQPLQVGTSYGSGYTGTARVLTCHSGDAEADTVQVRIDQLTEVAGVVTAAAVQATCLGPGLGGGLFAAIPYRAIPTTPHAGYYSVGAGGSIAGFGNDDYLAYLGDLVFVGNAGYLSSFPLNQLVVGMTQTSDGGGYWLVASDGGVFAFGDARFFGSTVGEGVHLNEPIVGMAATPDDKGYWLVAADGGVFAFGDATYHGSAASLLLHAPVVGMTSTADGKGYWLVAADGGIFAYGDAAFYGSAGNLVLNKPVVGIARTPDGAGYWFAASDGGVFSFGDATFHGSAANLDLALPIVGIASPADGAGYWLAAQDGGIYGYGDAPQDGSMVAGTGGAYAVVGISTLPGIST